MRQSRGLFIPNRIDALHDEEQDEGNNAELYNRIGEQTDIRRGRISVPRYREEVTATLFGLFDTTNGFETFGRARMRPVAGSST